MTPLKLLPDTGRLRDDLIALLKGTQPHSAEDQLCVMRGMVSACGSDAELATAFYEQVVDAKRSAALELMRRAQTRGEVSEATDIQFLVDAAPAMLIFRHLLTPHPVDEEYLTRLVDEVWLPLLTAKTPLLHLSLPIPRSHLSPTPTPEEFHVDPRQDRPRSKSMRTGRRTWFSRSS